MGIGLALLTILRAGTITGPGHSTYFFWRRFIRSFGVGLLALATVAAAGVLLRYRRLAASAKAGRGRSQVEALYAAGL